MKNIIKNAIINAGGTAGYVLLLSGFFNYMERTFGDVPDNEFMAPVIMLLVFIISATITSFLVFGRPILWYLDGKKREAYKLLGFTIFALVIIVLFFVSIM